MPTANRAMRAALLAALLFAALAQQASAGAVPVLAVPMEVHPHGLYLQVTLNGVGPLRFQFDTAAGWHAINWAVAERTPVSMKEHPGGAEGAGDKRVRAAEVKNASVRLGSFDLPLSPAAAVALDGVSDRKGITLDGLLGAPLLKRYVVETDITAGEFRLHQPGSWSPKDHPVDLPVRVDGMGVPHLLVAFQMPDGSWREGEFKIDSAAGGSTLVFAAPFARQLGLPEAIQAGGGKALADEIGGIGGTSRMWYARLGKVRLGAHEFDHPVVGITDAKGGTLAQSGIAGIIGGGLLHRFDAAYDCIAARLYLRPTRRLGRPFEEDMSGLRWLNQGEGRRDFHVRAVLPGTPAARAGIQPGDQLLAVDGRPASAMTRGDVTDALRRHGKLVKLRLLRGGREVEIRLRLERLV